MLKNQMKTTDCFLRKVYPCAMRGRWGEGHYIQTVEINGTDICNCLTTSYKDSIILEEWNIKNMADKTERKKKYAIRKLTEKECWRHMGYKDEDFNKAKKVTSKSQLYKESGNAIVKQVLMGIFLQLNIQGIKNWNDRSKDELQGLIGKSLGREQN